MPSPSSTSTSSIPSTMHAWTYTAPGPPTTALTLNTSHPTPSASNLKPNSALIKISHTGFNAGFLLIMQLLPSWMHATPAIPELDFSGEIIAIKDSRTTDLKLATRTKVFGCCPPASHLRFGWGALAEYVIVPTDTIAPIPVGMSMEQAAGLCGCGCTAVQIVRKAGIKRGDSVLINGGSGGLGSILVQVVKAVVGESGLVVATCSGSKMDFVRGLGADEVLDYTKHESLARYLGDTYQKGNFDTVIDTVGIQELYLRSPQYLKERGTFVNVGGMTVPPNWIAFLGAFWMMLLNMFYPSFLSGGVARKYVFLSGYANEKDLAEVKGLVEEGKLKVPIDSVWEMEEALEGYKVIESKRAMGKVVVRVQGL